MRVANEVVFNGADLSTDQTSSAYSLYQIYGWAAQFEFTSTPTGTMKVQVSCDPIGNQSNPANATVTNWTDLANSSSTVSAAGNLTYNVNLAFYNWVRFVWTASGGSAGALTGRLNVKGV